MADIRASRVIIHLARVGASPLPVDPTPTAVGGLEDGDDMPGRGTEIRAKKSQALVRMDSALAAAVAAAAKAADLTVAAWFRMLAVESLKIDPDLAAPTEPAYRPEADVAELGRIVRLISRNNGAVVQLTATLRETGETQLHRDAEQVLTGLRSLKRELTDLVLEKRNDRRFDSR